MIESKWVLGGYFLCNEIILSLINVRFDVVCSQRYEFIIYTNLFRRVSTIVWRGHSISKIEQITKFRLNSSSNFRYLIRFPILSKLYTCCSLQIGFSNWLIPFFIDPQSNLFSLRHRISSDSFYSPPYKNVLISGLSSMLSNIPSTTLDIILEPISLNSIVFQVCTSPLLNPILTAEIKNSLASLHPFYNFPIIYSVLMVPNSPALQTAN